MTPIKLYGYATSPFVRKVGAFLYYKQLDFDHVPVNPIAPDEILAFSGGTQVPVLAIGDEWKRDSTPIGLWLDKRFAQRPLLPADDAQRNALLAIDDWINNNFFPAFFRAAADAPDTLAFRFRAWRLAALLSAHTPLPEQVRHSWPDLLRQAPFIQAIIAPMDRNEPLEVMQQRVAMEMVGHLGDGPYFGSSEQPTLIDLNLFVQLVFGYMAGLEDRLAIAAIPAMKGWIMRMRAHLPRNPLLLPDDYMVKWLDDVE